MGKFAVGGELSERTAGHGRVDVDDEGGVLGLGFLLDSGDVAEELVGDVGHNGGAARGDSFLGEKAGLRRKSGR